MIGAAKQTLTAPSSKPEVMSRNCNVTVAIVQDPSEPDLPREVKAFSRIFKAR